MYINPAKWKVEAAAVQQDGTLMVVLEDDSLWISLVSCKATLSVKQLSLVKVEAAAVQDDGTLMVVLEDDVTPIPVLSR
jgi:hypothetical protein